eukprot:15477178-Alexandrium_andersonii.AAC.1
MPCPPYLPDPLEQDEPLRVWRQVPPEGECEDGRARGLVANPHSALAPRRQSFQISLAHRRGGNTIQGGREQLDAYDLDPPLKRRWERPDPRTKSNYLSDALGEGSGHHPGNVRHVGPQIPHLVADRHSGTHDWPCVHTHVRPHECGRRQKHALVMSYPRPCSNKVLQSRSTSSLEDGPMRISSGRDGN